MDSELVVDIVVDAGLDTLKLVPFLFITYVVLEALEHFAGDKVSDTIRRAGAAGPVVGALLGIVPQCGFSAMGATLYAGRVITLGTLIAVFLSTSDEMLPVLIANQAPVYQIVSILISKAIIGIVTGAIVDAVLSALRSHPKVYSWLRTHLRGASDVMSGPVQAGAGTSHIHELCEYDHCGCDDDEHEHDAAQGKHAKHAKHEAEHADHSHSHANGTTGSTVWSIVKAALSHTLQVSVFIFLVSLVLVAILELVGEDTLATFLAGNEVLAVFASALVGLIPNCAASVVICELYLEGILALGPMMAGSLAAAGAGYLVLFRTNHHPRENIAILILLYVASVLWGLLLVALGL